MFKKRAKMNSNNVFANLIAAYPTFDVLRPYIEGLGIQVNTKEGDPLVVCRYNREKADLSNPIVRAFRSVIWDSLGNRPVFVAPAKSEPLATAPPTYDQTLLVEDFVDGVMVNVFLDPRAGKWRLATRSRLDADNKFYEHTFASLFMSAWSVCYPAAPAFENLNPAMSYSFVLQHPANRIVVPVGVPQVWCVEASTINPLGQVMTLPVGGMLPLLSPRRYAVTDAQQFNQLLQHLEQHEGIRSQGLVVRELGTGRRWKARTNAYVMTKKLRGNHSRLEYVWFENMQKGTLDTYLGLYPEEKAQASVAMKNWARILTEVYEWYVHVYKVRDVAKDTIPAHYKGVLFDLHGEYIKRLAPAKLSLTWNEFQSVMARQDLKRIVFLTTFKAGASAPPSAKRTVAAKEKKVAAAAAASAGGGATSPKAPGTEGFTDAAMV